VISDSMRIPMHHQDIPFCVGTPKQVRSHTGGEGGKAAGPEEHGRDDAGSTDGPGGGK
jgi:hypothetical protein